MILSVFTDELFKDAAPALPEIASWGAESVDFRGLVNGKGIEYQTDGQLRQLRARLDELGLRVGALQSSLCKVHLPDKARQAQEMEKLEGLIRAAEALGCPLARVFNYWQREEGEHGFGTLCVRPDEMSKVLDMFEPIAARARRAGLVLGFENCGQTPDEVIALVEALGVPGWGMAWDASNYYELVPAGAKAEEEYLVRCLRYANMIHVKATSILPELPGVKVPWARVLRGALATGRDMPISIETHNPAGSGLSHAECTRRSFVATRALWPSGAPKDLRSAVQQEQSFERSYEGDPVRFAVVGLGMGRFRATQLQQTPGTRLMGVCDIREERAREVGEALGVPYSADIERFLRDPEVEVMYVVTPTGLHCSVAEQCLRAGKHVLTTKPMDVSVANCDAAIRAAQESGKLLGIDFDVRHEPLQLELMEAVRQGWFGRMLAANVTLYIRRTDAYYAENGGWRGTWRLDGGGAMCNQGVHEVDRLICLLGMPRRVRAAIDAQTHSIEAEDIGAAQWEYENGCIARFASTTSYPVDAWFLRLELHGTEGAFVHTSGGPQGTHTAWGKAGEWSETAPYEMRRVWRQGSDNFASAVRLGTSLTGDGRQGRLSRIVLDAMYQSARSGEGYVDINV